MESKPITTYNTYICKSAAFVFYAIYIIYRSREVDNSRNQT